MKYCLAFLLMLWTTSAQATLIEGRVVLGDTPLAGMKVLAYADLNPAGPPTAESAETGADGKFRLEAAPGFVALYAKSSDGRYFAFCGRNPVHVQDQPLWAGLQAVEVTRVQLSPYADEYTAALEGVVMHEGRPVAGAYVSLYLDVAEDLKGQGYRISPPTSDDGVFVFDGLPESHYFLVARKRQTGERVGPVLAGDLLGIYAGNPLQLNAGQLSVIRLQLVARQPGDQDAGLPDRPGSITLTGSVLDSAGNPRAGLHVFAYTDPVIGHQRPAALSPQTGPDGRFAINFRDPGSYYIGAREAYGDSPAPGELFGLYEGSADHGVKIVSGKNEPIEIRVLPISLE